MHFADLACSLARASEGSRMDINRAMMAMTTNSSTSVKALRLGVRILRLLNDNMFNLHHLSSGGNPRREQPEHANQRACHAAKRRNPKVGQDSIRLSLRPGPEEPLHNYPGVLIPSQGPIAVGNRPKTTKMVLPPFWMTMRHRHAT